MMDDDERAALAQLPDSVIAYRGLSDDGVVEGRSWTLDERVAIRFAYRFAAGDHDALVATTMLPSRAVLAYLKATGAGACRPRRPHLRRLDPSSCSACE
jgi:hypothetical protein